MPLTVREILGDKRDPGGRIVEVAPDAPVREAVARMVARDISSIVVMQAGRMAGLFTLRELLRGLDRHGAALLDMPVGEVMNSDPPSVVPTQSADELRALMTEHHVTHAPVLEDGALVGIISFHDIARSAVSDATFENKLLKQYIKHWPT